MRLPDLPIIRLYWLPCMVLTRQPRFIVSVSSWSYDISLQCTATVLHSAQCVKRYMCMFPGAEIGQQIPRWASLYALQSESLQTSRKQPIFHVLQRLALASTLLLSSFESRSSYTWSTSVQNNAISMHLTRMCTRWCTKYAADYSAKALWLSDVLKLLQKKKRNM